MASLCSHLHNYEGRLIWISPGQYVKIISPDSISCFLNLDSAPNQIFFSQGGSQLFCDIPAARKRVLMVLSELMYKWKLCRCLSSCSQTGSLNIPLKVRFSSFGSICCQFLCPPTVFNLKQLLNP